MNTEIIKINDKVLLINYTKDQKKFYITFFPVKLTPTKSSTLKKSLIEYNEYLKKSSYNDLSMNNIKLDNDIYNLFDDNMELNRYSTSNDLIIKQIYPLYKNIYGILESNGKSKLKEALISDYKFYNVNCLLVYYKNKKLLINNNVDHSHICNNILYLIDGGNIYVSDSRCILNNLRGDIIVDVLHNFIPNIPSFINTNLILKNCPKKRPCTINHIQSDSVKCYDEILKHISNYYTPNNIKQEFIYSDYQYIT